MRTLYKLLGLALLARIIFSGNPRRIAKHLVRRQAHKQVARGMRRL